MANTQKRPRFGFQQLRNNYPANGVKIEHFFMLYFDINKCQIAGQSLYWPRIG